MAFYGCPRHGGLGSLRPARTFLCEIILLPLTVPHPYVILVIWSMNRLLSAGLIRDVRPAKPDIMAKKRPAAYHNPSLLYIFDGSYDTILSDRCQHFFEKIFVMIVFYDFQGANAPFLGV